MEEEFNLVHKKLIVTIVLQYLTNRQWCVTMHTKQQKKEQNDTSYDQLWVMDEPITIVVGNRGAYD